MSSSGSLPADAPEVTAQKAGQPGTSRTSSSPDDDVLGAVGGNADHMDWSLNKTSPRRTLEEELRGEDFAERGLQRLADLADYVAHLVDGRSLGLFATEKPRTFEQVVGLASVIKAALQWFMLDRESRPKFVVELEKYLAESRPGENAVEARQHVADSQRAPRPATFSARVRLRRATPSARGHENQP